MTSPVRCLSGVLSVAVLAAPATSVCAEAPPKTRFVVAAVGDSLTDPKSHGGGYLAYLKQRCPKSTFDNYGRGGQMVSQFRKRFLSDVFGADKPKYTHVIVLGGVNDLISDKTAQRTPKRVIEDLTFIVEETKKRGAVPILMTVAPWAGFKKFWTPKRQHDTLVLNAWLRAQPGTVDTYALLLGDHEQLCEGCATKDGLHWTRLAHEKVGKQLYEQHFSSCE